jgi:radical SAM superfamily enzyme YgiQ (UPF0313 family)
MARAKEWSENRSALAATRGNRSRSIPADGSMATTSGLPRVSVPVLSKATVSTLLSVSMYKPPRESRETVRRTIDFAKRLDTETNRVSIAHALPGTELHDYGERNGLINLSMVDEAGHQMPNITYPGLDEAELVDAVERFYGEYYFRPRVVWRVVRKAILNSHERRRLAKEARVSVLAFRAQTIRARSAQGRCWHDEQQRNRAFTAMRSAQLALKLVF